MSPSLYIHIPFCRRRCLYCNFYSSIYDRETASTYIDVLTTQIGMIDCQPSTIYIGGGTPTVQDMELFEKLLRAISRFLKSCAEFTVEANPESMNTAILKLLKNYGIDRLSIGLQSLDDRKLKRLGRLHTAERAKEAVAMAAAAGFNNISIDMIFGVWDERIESWKKELDEAVRLPVTHISCYELTYEKDTPLFNAVTNKSITPLNDCITAAMYENAIDRLSLGGFKQYEVSNFAKIGFECKHNLNYWDNNPYIGLGASAVSYMDGVRSKSISDAKEYIERFQSGKSLIESSEKLSLIRSAKETAAIKIRTRAGIDSAWFKEKTGHDFWLLEKRALPRLLEDGLIRHKKAGDKVTGIALKRKGFLLCDMVSSALL